MSNARIIARHSRFIAHFHRRFVVATALLIPLAMLVRRRFVGQRYIMFQQIHQAGGRIIACNFRRNRHTSYVVRLQMFRGKDGLTRPTVSSWSHVKVEWFFFVFWILRLFRFGRGRRGASDAKAILIGRLYSSWYPQGGCRYYSYQPVHHDTTRIRYYHVGDSRIQ